MRFNCSICYQPEEIPDKKKKPSKLKSSPQKTKTHQKTSRHNEEQKQQQYDDATHNFAEYLIGECREIIMTAFEEISKKHPPHQQLKEFIAEAPFTALSINNKIVSEATNLRIRTQGQVSSVLATLNGKGNNSESDDEPLGKRRRQGRVSSVLATLNGKGNNSESDDEPLGKRRRQRKAMKFRKTSGNCAYSKKFSNRYEK